MVKIGLSKIPSGNVYVRIKERWIRDVRNIIKKSNTILPKSTKDQLYRIENKNKVSLYFIKKFLINFEIPMEEFEKEIENITSARSTEIGIKKPKFPLNFETKEGARFIAAIMGDGELNKQLNVRYNNKEKQLINLVLKSAKMLFGKIDYKIYLRDDGTYQLHFPKIIGIIVSLLGIKPGCKSITNYGIPQFIMQSDKKIQAIFIKQFFNDEGNVRLKDRRLQIKQTAVISVSKNEAKQNPLKYAHKSLINIQKLLANQGIDSKISLSSYRKDRADWELSIYRIENLKIFQKKINFDLEYKKKLLEKSIKSYKFPSAARNGRLDFAFNCAKETQKRYGFITKHLLAKNCNRSLKTATYYLIDLKKTSQVICTEKPKNKYGQKKPHKYIVNI